LSEMASEAYFAQFGEVTAVKRTRFQKIVAKTMTANASTIPHVTHHDDADVTGLEAYRQALPPEAKLSPLIFLIKALVSALQAFPQFNASLTPDGESLVLKKYFHIGIAVDGPFGLLVPVLRDCDQKDMPNLAAELKELSALARGKGLPMDRMAGGCFAISSLGGIGGGFFSPIINAPDGSAFLPRQMLPLSLSYDHRVINGADAARFVRHVAQALTQWNMGERV